MESFETYLQTLAKEKYPKNLYEPVDYILVQGGKRIRPRLVMLAVEIFNGNMEHAVYPAAAFEMLHNFTLIHDDIMDLAPLRRGKETIYKKWNNNIAILSGDALATMALQQLMLTPCDEKTLLQMITIFAQTSLEICEGQQHDLDYETTENVPIEAYIEMIRLKTAVMLAGCLKTGAILAQAAEKEQVLLYDFGINIGIAFQLMDDLLDIYSNIQEFGKENGGDIRANKKTHPYLLALQIGTEQQKQTLQHYFSSVDFDFNEKFTTIKSIFDQLDIKTKVEDEIKKYIDNAVVLVDVLSISQSNKEKLYALAQEFSNRVK